MRDWITNARRCSNKHALPCDATVRKYWWLAEMQRAAAADQIMERCAAQPLDFNNCTSWWWEYPSLENRGTVS